jgi:hypothetical protein
MSTGPQPMLVTLLFTFQMDCDCLSRRTPSNDLATKSRPAGVSTKSVAEALDIRLV